MEVKIPKKTEIIQNKDFQTIQIKVLFPFQKKEEELAKEVLLPSMLKYMNNEYDTEEKFQKARKEKYILNINCSSIVTGTSGFFCFNMIIPDTKALGINILEEQFKFFQNMIYNPKIINNGFDTFEFQREKKNIEIVIENSMKKLRPYQAIRGLELIDDDGLLSRCIYNHSEQLELVTPENLYQFYKEKIFDNTPLIFVMGDVEKEEISKYTKKYLYKNKKDTVSFIKDYNHFLTPNKEDVAIINEKKQFKDSSISLFYKVLDMTENDFIYLELVNALLSSLSSMLLDKKLRYEEELIYSSQVINYKRFGVFEITAFIHKNKKDIIVEKIKEVLDELKDVTITRPLLRNIKERHRINLIKHLDNKSGLLNDVIFRKLDIRKALEEENELINSIEAEDIASFIERLKLDTIYFIEEEDNGKY